MFQNKIQKRDGQIVTFDPQKISLAINKAMLATGISPKNGDIKSLTNQVISQIEVEVPTVENIQDIVEKTLMAYGYFDTAKSYILYRQEHAQKREQLETIQEKIQYHQLQVIKRDGTIELFDEQKLRSQISKYATGLGTLTKIDQIVKEVISVLRENITTKEIGNLLIMAIKAFVEFDPSYDKLAAQAFLAQQYKEVINTRYKYGQIDKIYRQAFVDNLKELVEIGKLDKRLLKFDLKKLSNALDPDRDNLFGYRGLETLNDKYFQKNHLGRTMETAQAFWMRIAMGLALNEKNKEKASIEFYDILSQLKFVNSSPTLFNAGTTFPQLSSCFLMTVQDDLHDIFKNYSDHADLSKWSGGIGTDWTNIRGTGAHIKTTGIESQGVIPFLRISNDVTVAINRSGRRRGAACVYLENWHYDFEEFLDLKRNTGDERRRTHDMNTAAWISDLFMKRVQSNGDWTLFSPDETPELHHIYGAEFEKKYQEYEIKASSGQIKLYKTLKAADLWKKMITRLFETGHPWITFKDPSNIRSPQDHAGVVHNSNLCTEITLNNSQEEVAVCNIGSVNLAAHIKKGKLDEKTLGETVEVAMRMLDNVIDINYYPIPETKNSNLRHRPVGLGLMGFQDALYLQNINFDSNQAVEFADSSMEIISYHAILASSHLAKEKGAYESYPGSKWDRGLLPQDTIKLLEDERRLSTEVKPTFRLDWTPVREHIKKHGMRNSNCMAIAPTASISNIVGVYPSIEAIYKNLYVKANKTGDFTVNNSYLIDDLKRINLWTEDLLEKIKAHDGSITSIPEIPQSIKDKYKEAFELDPRWSIKQAAYRGKWIDQSQSLNIFTNTTSGKELSDIYFFAWKMGLKTTYYLRTMGASSIEKSTVSASQAFAKTESQSTQILESPIEIQVSQEVKSCRIDDPSCEACQ